MEVRAAFLALALFLPFSEVYAVESHCASTEKVIWSCKKNKKYFSVCASGNISSAEGYMQYRAGALGNISFTYPPKKIHPIRTFTASLGGNSVDLSFENNQYKYVLGESVKGDSGIDVFKNDKFLSHIECDDSTWTLTLTSMMDLFSSIGIMKKHVDE